MCESVELPVTPAVPSLAAAIDRLAATDLDTLPDTALAEELLALDQQATRLQAQVLRRLATFDTRQISWRNGLKTSSWWRTHTHRNPATAHRDVRLARRLHTDPATSAALTAAHINTAHAHVIHTALRALPHHLEEEHREAIHHALLTQAKIDHPHALQGLADRIRAHVDPDGADLDAQHAHENRWLDIATTYQGAVYLHGILDPEAGALIKTALAALTRPTGPHDTRRASTRRADALTELARQTLNRGDLPDTGSVKPHISITISAEDLATNRGAGTLQDHPDLSFTTRTVRKWLCDAAVTRILLSPTGQPLDVGRETRTIPPALRKAVIHRDQHCQFPGCDAPPTWCDTHHLKHWADGGETKLDNLLLLCRQHHTHIHHIGTQNHPPLTAPPPAAPRQPEPPQKETPAGQQSRPPPQVITA